MKPLRARHSLHSVEDSRQVVDAVLVEADKYEIKVRWKKVDGRIRMGTGGWKKVNGKRWMDEGE